MARVTVLGLGNMGGALARAFAAPATRRRAGRGAAIPARGRGLRGLRPGRRLRLRLRRHVRGTHRPASPRRSPARPSCSWRPAARPTHADRRSGPPTPASRTSTARSPPTPRGSATRRRSSSTPATARPSTAPRDARRARRPTDIRRRSAGRRRGRRRPRLAVVPLRRHGRALPGRRVPRVRGRRPSVVFNAVPSFGIEIAAEAAYARELIARNDFTATRQRCTRPGRMEDIVAAAAGRRQRRIARTRARPDRTRRRERGTGGTRSPR